MECSTEFSEFLREIRLTKDQRNDLRVGHKTLRERLHAFEPLKDAIVSSFLQGSYRRSTAVRPKGDRRADVDVIVVTRLSEKEFTPTQAMDKFIPFLNKHYKDKWRQQGRSFGIELSYVEMDLVLTSAPRVADRPNVRSLQNYPMQSNGAEMLRLACSLATERRIRVCCPVHDALLVEGSAHDIASVVHETQRAMREASEVVLGGFALRSDAQIITSPERYLDKRGAEMWKTVWKVLGLDPDEPNPCTLATGLVHPCTPDPFVGLSNDLQGLDDLACRPPS